MSGAQRHPEAFAGIVAADAQRVANIAARGGSDDLLRALVRYGLRHDGLPGLSADRFHKLCREQGHPTSTGETA